MNTETALGEKMRDAGVDLVGARLYSEAVRVLRDGKLKPERALQRFLNDVLTDEALMDALALRYLREVAADMESSGAGAIMAAPKGQVASAPAAAADGMPGEAKVGLPRGQMSPASAQQQEDGGEGQLTDAQTGHVKVALSPSQDRNGAGHGVSAKGQRTRARPVREPSASDIKAAAMVMKSSARTVLNIGRLATATIIDGPRFVDLRVRDLKGMVERSFKNSTAHGRDAYTCLLILREINKLGVADPDAKWVDVLPEKTARRISDLTEDEPLRPTVRRVLESLLPVIEHAYA